MQMIYYAIQTKLSPEEIHEKLGFVDYKEYFKQQFENVGNRPININTELYINNFIKNYILNNFNDIFNQISLDVIELNDIKDEDEIKKIISLYYDYTKQNTKLMLSLFDIENRIKNFEQRIENKIN